MNSSNFPTEECEHLLEQVDATRQHARKTAFGAALCFSVAAALALSLVVALGDVLLRSNSNVVRYILSASLFVGVLLVAWRLLGFLKKFSITRQDLARWATRHGSTASLSVTSAVELAELGDSVDPRFGSPELRARALRAWFETETQPAWSQLVDTRTLRSGIFTLFVMLAVFAGALVLRPAHFGLALKRLVVPGAQADWPRQTELSFEGLPSVVPLGQPLTVQIFDRVPPLPAMVTLEYLAGDDTLPTEYPVARPDPAAHVVSVTLPISVEPFRIRAVGGDDRSMAWQSIDVVSAPVVENVIATIQPPDYSGMKLQELAGTRFRALAGSQVQFRGAFSLPVEEAYLRASQKPGSPSASSAGLEKWELELSRDRREFTIRTSDRMAVSASARFHIDVVSSGAKVSFENTVELACFIDQPPRVRLKQPAVVATGVNGKLRVTAVLEDDFGLELYTLTLLRSWSETAASTRSALPESESKSEVIAGWTANRDTPTALAVSEPINLVGYSLQVGEELSLVLTCRDTLGQETFQSLGPLAVVSEEELVSELSKFRSEILSQAERIISAQQSAESSASRIRRLANEGRSAAAAALASDLAAEQFAIQGILDSDGSGTSGSLDAATNLGEQIDALAMLAEDAGLPGGALRNQLQDAKRALASQASPAVNRAALKAEDVANILHADSADFQSMIAELQESQAEATAALSAVRDVLARGKMLALFRDEVAAVLMRQQAIASATQTVQIARIQTPAYQTAAVELEQMAAEQMDLAEQLRRVADRMRDGARELGDQGSEMPDERAAIAKALGVLDGKQAVTQMRRAAADVASRSYAAATAKQEDVGVWLAESLAILGGDNPGGRDRSRPSVESQLSSVFRRLVDQQTQLVNFLAASGVGGLEDFSIGQESLQQETRRVMRQLKPEQQPIAQIMADATEAQSDAITAGNEDTIDRFDATMAFAEDALRYLIDALSMIETDKPSQNDSTRAAVADVRRSLELVLMQVRRQLSELQEQVGTITQEPRGRTAEAEIDDQWRDEWCETQREMTRPLSDARESLVGMQVFVWLLDDCVEQLERSAATLMRNRVNDAELACQRAIRQIEAVIEALAESEDEGAPEDQAGDGDETGAEPEGNGGITLAELLLIRQLQVDLKQQTAELNREIRGSDDASKQSSLRQLSVMQSELADLVDRLLSEMER